MAASSQSRHTDAKKSSPAAKLAAAKPKAPVKKIAAGPKKPSPAKKIVVAAKKPAAPVKVAAKPQLPSYTVTTIRGGVATPQTDVLNEDDAADYKKWNKAREAQLKRK